MPTRKIKDYAIEVKERFILRKGKVYLLSREERGEMYKFISKQLRKEYIRPSKSPQTAPVFFVEKKDSKKYMVQDYIYLNEWTIKIITLYLLCYDLGFEFKQKTHSYIE